jgi:serine/threonine-protein kinase RIM15
MERSVSQEIREERQDLKEAAEQSLNVIVDLGLDGRVRWVSPSWREVVGTPADTVVGKPVADVLLQDGEANPFLEAIETMRQDDSKSQIIRFRIKLGPESQFTKDSAILAAQREAEGFRQDEFEDEEEGSIITLEGQGIMVYDRTTGEMSNVSTPGQSSEYDTNQIRRCGCYDQLPCREKSP